MGEDDRGADGPNTRVPADAGLGEAFTGVSTASDRASSQAEAGAWVAGVDAGVAAVPAGAGAVTTVAGEAAAGPCDGAADGPAGAGGGLGAWAGGVGVGLATGAVAGPVAGVAAGGAGAPTRAGRNASGSRYPFGSEVSRIPSWTNGSCRSGAPDDAANPTWPPSATVSPFLTWISPRCESVTEKPSGVAIVIVRPRCGTVPAYEITPEAGASTASPATASISMPRC